MVGLVIIDSFVFETPLFTTMRKDSIHSPEIEYFRNNENGMCSDFNVSNYAHTIVEALNSQDKLDKLKKGCREDADVYTLEAMVENFYEGIVKCLQLK
jgi:hypothetical protein